MKTENEAFAEFMGGVYHPGAISWDGAKGAWELPGKDDLDFSDLEYDTSWDWLMPVVFKVEELYSIAFPPGEKFVEMVMNHEEPIDHHYMDVIALPMATPIEEVYSACYDFITWYLTQSKPKEG